MSSEWVGSTQYPKLRDMENASCVAKVAGITSYVDSIHHNRSTRCHETYLQGCIETAFSVRGSADFKTLWILTSSDSEGSTKAPRAGILS